jgi:hypothetical protein
VDSNHLGTVVLVGCINSGFPLVSMRAANSGVGGTHLGVVGYTSSGVRTGASGGWGVMPVGWESPGVIQCHVHWRVTFAVQGIAPVGWKSPGVMQRCARWRVTLVIQGIAPVG